MVNCNSRINEFGADAYSNEDLGYGPELCSGLIKISVGKCSVSVASVVCYRMWDYKRYILYMIYICYYYRKLGVYGS